METGESLRAWLTEMLDTMEPGQSFPPDSRIAKRWGMSPRTVRRIMSRAREEGLVVRIPGKGTFKPGGEPVEQSSEPEETVSSEERLARALTEAISLGELRRGNPLPQMKYLCLQYHVSQKTVIGAYARLRKRGLVKKIGKRFWVGGFNPMDRGALRKEAYIVTWDQKQRESIYADEHMGLAYQKLERELHSCNIRLRYATWKELPGLQRAWSSRGDYPVGMVFFGFDGRFFDELRRRLQLLGGKGRPQKCSVVVDMAEYGDYRTVPLHLSVLSRGNLNTTVARTAARYLSRRLRRDIVLLVEESYLRADPRRHFLRFQKLNFELAQAFEARPVRHVVISPNPRLTPRTLFEEYFRNDTAYLEYIMSKYGIDLARHPERIEENISVATNCAAALDVSEGPTTWLFATDDLARTGWDELRHHRKRVPEDVALISMQNSPRKYHLGLTAFSPDYDLVGYLMAHSLIGDLPIQKTSHGYIRVPCPVIERLTTP